MDLSALQTQVETAAKLFKGLGGIFDNLPDAFDALAKLFKIEGLGSSEDRSVLNTLSSKK